MITNSESELFLSTVKVSARERLEQELERKERRGVGGKEALNRPTHSESFCAGHF